MSRYCFEPKSCCSGDNAACVRAESLNRAAASPRFRAAVTLGFGLRREGGMIWAVLLGSEAGLSRSRSRDERLRWAVRSFAVARRRGGMRYWVGAGRSGV